MNLKDFMGETLHNMMVSDLAEAKEITLEQAKAEVSGMSFKEYLALSEAGTAIVPPSGNTIGPSATATTPGGSAAPGSVKSIWPGKGAPPEVGMTVGLKGPNGLPVPGEISQVDQAAKGVKVKNPTTGQEEWQSLDNLQPFMASGQAAPTPGTVNSADQQPGLPAPTAESVDLLRMRQLAGIKENCSAGATGAGAIAVAPAAMGKMQKRQPTDEELKKEYTRTEPAKTIVGDTKPHQASGELSATLVANGKKAAGRTNNGMKKQR